jgi:hypothetical protein
LTKNSLERAHRNILRAIEAAKRTKGWPRIEEGVNAFLAAPEGAEQFKSAAQLSERLYIQEESDIDMRTWDAFHRLRRALVPLAQLCWPWYQKGGVPSFWQNLWELIGFAFRR